MKSSTASQMRQWTGPAIFSFGFRPLFLIAALWAAVAMVIWLALLSGLADIPSRFDPVTWHVHEFLFGYLSAVIAGFLLTAVPNWTGRLPVVGWSLAGLSSLWLLGRVAIALSSALPVIVVAVADLVFLAVLWLVVLREIVEGKNWRNLPVLALVGILMLANGLYHFEAANGDDAAQGYGLRLGVSVAVVLICLIGGKIIPSFTRNWLVKQGAKDLPTPPMQRYDKLVIAITILTLLSWTINPEHDLVALMLFALGGLHLRRLWRWKGLSCVREPLVWVLHVAYVFIPLGAICVGTSSLAPSILSYAAALHVWTAGAVGLMTVAVMTRASLGHSGHALHSGAATTAIYLSLVASVFARVAADLAPNLRMELLDASALLWVSCFAGFVCAYGPMLMRPKQDANA